MVAKAYINKRFQEIVIQGHEVTQTLIIADVVRVFDRAMAMSPPRIHNIRITNVDVQPVFYDMFIALMKRRPSRWKIVQIDTCSGYSALQAVQDIALHYAERVVAWCIAKWKPPIWSSTSSSVRWTKEGSHLTIGDSHRPFNDHDELCMSTIETAAIEPRIRALKLRIHRLSPFTREPMYQLFSSRRWDKITLDMCSQPCLAGYVAHILKHSKQVSFQYTSFETKDIPWDEALNSYTKPLAIFMSRLSFQHCRFNNETVQLLQQALRMNRTIHTLDISYCNLADETMADFMTEAIPYMVALKRLDLSGNNCGIHATKRLASLLSSSSCQWTYLGLSSMIQGTVVWDYFAPIAMVFLSTDTSFHHHHRHHNHLEPSTSTLSQKRPICPLRRLRLGYSCKEVRVVHDGPQSSTSSTPSGVVDNAIKIEELLPFAKAMHGTTAETTCRLEQLDMGRWILDSKSNYYDWNEDDITTSREKQSIFLTPLHPSDQQALQQVLTLFLSAVQGGNVWLTNIFSTDPSDPTIQHIWDRGDSKCRQTLQELWVYLALNRTGFTKWMMQRRHQEALADTIPMYRCWPILLQYVMRVAYQMEYDHPYREKTKTLTKNLPST